MTWWVNNYDIIIPLFLFFFFKAVYATCSNSFPYSLVLNVRALTLCILTPSTFLTEHAIKHNHKPTATPPLTIIAAADNHSLPLFAYLAILPSPPPSEKQRDHYLSFLQEGILSSELEHNANAYVDIPSALILHVILTGVQTEQGGWRRRILGYCIAGAFFNFSEVVSVAKKSNKNKGTPSPHSFAFSI